MIWRMEHARGGGYDSMTDAIHIYQRVRLVLTIDRADYDGVRSGSSKASTPNQQMVADAEFIVAACNEYEVKIINV